VALITPNNDGSWRLVARRGRATNRLEREAASSRSPIPTTGEEGPGRKARDPREEEEDLLRKLVVWLQRSKVPEVLFGKAPYKVLLKRGTDNHLYHALNNCTK
jgi:hypothetical protein